MRALMSVGKLEPCRALTPTINPWAVRRQSEVGAELSQYPNLAPTSLHGCAGTTSALHICHPEHLLAKDLALLIKKNTEFICQVIPVGVHCCNNCMYQSRAPTFPNSARFAQRRNNRNALETGMNNYLKEGGFDGLVDSKALTY